MDEATTEDEPCPDAGAQGHVQDVVVALPRPEPGLADRGEIGVVGEVAPTPEPVGEELLVELGEPAVGNVGRGLEAAVAMVDPARCADDELDVVAELDRRALRGATIPDVAEDGIDEGPELRSARSTVVGRAPLAVQDRSVVVDDADAHVCATDVGGQGGHGPQLPSGRGETGTAQIRPAPRSASAAAGPHVPGS